MIYELLRLRDGVDCSRLEAADLKGELIALAESDVQPSYVPMRAAACLITLFAGDPAVVDHARAWVSGEKLGLGMLVADRIGSFAVEDREGIVRAAVDPRVRRRLGVDVVEGGR
jgi:hypothetical protein